MKKFSFPLDRVLSWRHTQTRLEEANLARLTGELRAIDLQTAALHQSVAEARQNLLTAASATPIEIGALEHYRAATANQIRYLVQTRRTLEHKLAQQTQVVLERRRDAELLNRLRDRRLNAWRVAADQEVERQAEESYLSRFTRTQHTTPN